MSRSRNIKPGFFKNEELSELPFEYRILFQGLWCEADREGRLEDRPKRIKAEIFPYDSVDVDSGLDALAAHGFIVRYEVDGKRFIEVSNFVKHQNPHKKEAASGIPAPEQERGEPRKDPEIPELAEEEPERAGLIPDSLLLIPDSTEANASGAEAPKADPIWGTGLAFLKRKGIPEKAARSLLGKLRQRCGDVTTGALLAVAESEDITDPAPWLMASANNAKNGANNGSRSNSAADRVAQNIQRALAEEAAGAGWIEGDATVVAAHG